MEKNDNYENSNLLKPGVGRVRNILLVLSGKGGVGKSSVTAGLALALANTLRDGASAVSDTHAPSLARQNEKLKVGVLDIDLTGPSLPKLLLPLGQDAEVKSTVDGAWLPIAVSPSSVNDAVPHSSSSPDLCSPLLLMSIAFLLPNPDDPVIWRGPKKTAMIRQFVNQVRWGDLDYLVIDTPPGTSDEHLAILETLLENESAAGKIDGSSGQRSRVSAVLVTTPQMASVLDVKRELSFCRVAGLRMLGILENMSGYECEGCGEHYALFARGGGAALAEESHLPLLAELPLSPILSRLDRFTWPLPQPYRLLFTDIAAKVIEANQ